MPKKKQRKPTETPRELVIREEATVKVGNDILDGRWRLTKNELQLIVALASQIPFGDDGEGVYSIPISELGSFMGLDPNGKYGILERLADDFVGKKLRLKNDKRWLTTVWVSWIEYEKDTSTLTYQFSSKIAPLLSNLKEAYSKFEAKELMAFKSVYTMRWYMLFTKWEKYAAAHNNKLTFKIDEIREQLELGDKYKYFKDFNLKVVEPAIKELNATTDFVVKANPKKTGRKYTDFIFTIKRRETIATTAVDVSSDVPPTIDTPAIIGELVAFGVPELAAAEISAAYDSEKIREGMQYIREVAKKKKVSSNEGYLKWYLKQNPGLFSDSEIAAAGQVRLSPEEQAALEAMKKEAETNAAKEVTPADMEVQKAKAAEMMKKLRSSTES